MKLVLQKVLSASVSVNNTHISTISSGYIIYLGIAAGDTEDKIEYLIKKLLSIQLFNKESIVDKDYEILCISQFTLFATIKNGKKPDYHKAEKYEQAKILYNKFCDQLENKYNKYKIKRGAFGEEMIVEQKGIGPYTIIIEK